MAVGLGHDRPIYSRIASDMCLVSSTQIVLAHVRGPYTRTHCSTRLSNGKRPLPDRLTIHKEDFVPDASGPATKSKVATVRLKFRATAALDKAPIERLVTSLADKVGSKRCYDPHCEKPIR